jgi:hypothetical protein
MALSQNQFAPSAIQGMVDQRYSYATTSVQIDVSEPASLLPGAPLKIVNSAGGVPKVLACTDKADACYGFLNLDLKSTAFVAGSMAEISQSGNVIYLTSTGAIGRGVAVVLDVAGGGVAAATGATGARVVGYAFDRFAAAGALGRVHIKVPGGLLDSAVVP